MNKATKIMIIIASSLIIIGAVMFISVLNAFNWDFYKLNTVSYGTNTHLVDEDVHSISISSQTADGAFVVSEDDKCISGFTILDNFNFYGFLIEIGVPPEVVEWDD